MTEAGTHRPFRDVLAGFYWTIWHPLPSWAKWSVGIGALFLFSAVRMAWGEHRFVGGFFESLIAQLIYSAIPLAALFGGIYAGAGTTQRTKSTILGIVVGLAVFALIGSMLEVSKYIPGVGWRIQAMQDARDEDVEVNP